ncbi:hypothetical protein Pcinc_011662, partial [Petrolisthes cinctipes]
NYSRLLCEIMFVRSMGYYLIQIYIPSSLIVVISWVSFCSTDQDPSNLLCSLSPRLLFNSVFLLPPPSRTKTLRSLFHAESSQLVAVFILPVFAPFPRGALVNAVCINPFI